MFKRGKLLKKLRLGDLIVPVLMSSGPVFGSVDFDGNGVSELWQLQHTEVQPDSSDFDGDGFSNRDEAIAGTDPSDEESFLRLGDLALEDGEIHFSWQAEAGKLYEIEQWNDETGRWQKSAVAVPSLITEPRVLAIPETGAGGIFRLATSDIDFDGDGLSAWEEGLLGSSDEDPVVLGGSAEGDYLAGLRLLESEEGALLTNGVRLPRWRPDDKKAARFLLRATFGPTEESIAEVMAMGFTGWIDHQLELPALGLRTSMFRNGITLSSANARYAWWRSANIAEDQLRQRMAYALSQILVVNMGGGSVVGDNTLNQTKFYDLYINGAFGPYRDVLEGVTYSPVMGFYLSHLNNRKTDDPVNPTRFPDENFAREIMQLFTIGLWELNSDGSRRLDLEGEFIPTYDNDTITEMAKVFTGMSHSTSNNGRPATSFYDVARGNDYLNPMLVWDEEHEPGIKVIINGVELDGTQSGEEEVQAALDALVTHQSTAPFVSRLLIQRFTSSNPGPGYLARVTSAWKVGSAENPGDLGEVIKAILLDPEVLNDESSNRFKGKVREPIIRFASLARAFHLARADGKYSLAVDSIRNDFGQFPTLSPSVFNFYLPDFSPEGELRETGIASPELQLGSMSQYLQSDSRFAATIEQSGISDVFDFSKELLLVDDPEALVDRVDLLLTGGRLGVEARTAIVTAVGNEPDDLTKVRSAVYLVSQSMSATILK